MGKKMQVGVTLYSYMQDLSRQKINVDQAIEHAAGCGAKCVEIVDSCHFLEWPHPKLTDIYHVKEKIKSLKMDIACFSQYTENEYSADYKCTEEDKLQQVKEPIRYAHILDAPMTRITPYTNVDPLINRVIEKSLPFAEKYNIIITLEIHSPQKPDKFIRTMQQFKSKYLGLVPDFSAWYYQGGLC